MSNKDSLGDRMKDYEGRSQSHLPRRTYTILRIDGKAFHSFLKHAQRPYDLGVMDDMDSTAKFLCENIQGCKLAYVQSDEITLVLTDFETITTQAWFDGNVQKITSVSASMAAAKFNHLRLLRLCKENNVVNRPYLTKDSIESTSLASFDSRCWVIPDWVEVFNCLLWRQQDCTRNSIQMLGQSEFSHKELQGMSCNDIQDMLMTQKGINWNDCPDGFKRGRCIVKKTELQYLEASLMKDGSIESSYVERSKWVVEVPPILTQDREWLWNYIPRMGI